MLSPSGKDFRFFSTCFLWDSVAFALGRQNETNAEKGSLSPFEAVVTDPSTAPLEGACIELYLIPT